MSELNEKLATAWEGFAKGDWQNEVNVRDFIQKNYTPYEGDESFLAGATEATTKLWDTVMEGVKQENRTHAPVDFDTAPGFHHHLSRRRLYRERSGKNRWSADRSAAETCDHPVWWY